MDQLKVLILTTSFPLSKESVSGLFVKRLVDNFPPNIQPLVLVPSDKKNYKKSDQFGYKVLQIKYAPSFLRSLTHNAGGIPVALKRNRLNILLVPFLLFAMFFRCYSEAKNVDLIHANWSICGLVGGVVGKLLSKPVVTTIRGEDVNKAKLSILYKIILVFSTRLSTKTVGVSNDLVTTAKSFNKLDKGKFEYIPNGVDRSLLESCTNERGDTDKGFVIVSVGNLTENKNISLAINAVHDIVKKGNKITLNIIGDGPKRSELEKLIESYRLSNCIFILGKLSPKEVYKQIRKANILLLTSFREGRPNVILESMVLGTPVVASKIKGVEELIEHNYSGLLFSPFECNELVSCLNKICADKNLQERLSTNALNKIKSDELFWDVSASKYVTLYKQLI